MSITYLFPLVLLRYYLSLFEQGQVPINPMVIPAQTQTPVEQNPGSTKTQIMQDASVYIPSSYIAQVFGFLNAFLIRYLLGPALMGVWSSLQIILKYGGYLSFGSLGAGAKEIPYQIGRKDYARAELVQNNVVTFSLTMASLGMFLVVGASWFFGRGLSAPFRVGLIVAGVLILTQRAYNNMIMLLRSHKNFVLLSKVTMLTAVTDVVLGATLIWFFGIYGLYAAMLLSLTLVVGWSYGRISYNVRLAWNRDVLRKIIKIGSPLMVVGIVMTVLRTMDKILIVKFMGITQLGFYSIAIMAGNYVFGLSSLLSILTLPRYSEKFGDKADVGVMCSYMDQVNRVLGTTMPVMLGFLYFLTPILIRILLKEFSPGIVAMQTLLMGTFFLCLTPQASNFLLAIGKQIRILPAVVSGAAISFILNYWVVQGPRDLTLVATATSIAYLVTFLILFITTSLHHRRRVSLWVPLSQALGPFVYVVGVLCLLNWLCRGISSWWALPLKIFLYALACVYPIWRIDQKTWVIRKAIGLFLERVQKVWRKGLLSCLQ